MMATEERNNDYTMTTEKFYLKVRGIRIPKEEADAYGVRRIYNWTSNIDAIPGNNEIDRWASSLFDVKEGEWAIVETALKTVDGQPIHVASCIVFLSSYFSNVYYIKNLEYYGISPEMMHLFN